MADSPKSPALQPARHPRLQHLIDAVVRTSKLRNRANGIDSTDAHWMHEALRELDSAHEELQVAEEELEAKADQLQTAQHALQLERAAYHELFDAAPDAYLVTDRCGVIQRANVRACELLQLPPAFVIGKPLAVFSSDADRRVLCEMLTLVCATPQPMTFELAITPRGGTEARRTVASVVQAARAAEGGSLRWIIREQRAPSETRDAQARAEIELLAREVAEERSRRALAERKVEARNRRLAYVCHELRNPLLTLAGWLDILMHETDAGEREEVAEILRGSVRVMTVLVDELVDKTRVDEALLVLALQEVELSELLQRLCEEFRVIARARGVELQADVDPHLGRVRCDPLRMRQVVVNLLDNASKFTPSGGRIELRAETSGECIEISVRDNGRGLAPDKLSTIFEPFVRVEAEQAGVGLGLGLNIAQRLVELHHGSIVALSAGVGLGATFRVRLPRA